MHHKLHFLGWNRSLADAVASHLVCRDSGNLTSLRDTILVVPTAQAGRRLRRALAARAASANAGVLTGPVLTPFRLLECSGSMERTSAFAEMAVWIDTLDPAVCASLKALFPRPPAAIDFEWRRKTADTLIQLRRQLAEAGLTPSDVTASDRIDDAEKRRWRDIQSLVDRVKGAMTTAGLVDPVEQQLAAAASANPPPGIRRVVLAACPEIAPILRTLLDRWSNDVSVEVLVHAPPACSNRFDSWGCPETGFWSREAVIDLGHAGARVVVTTDEKGQAAAVRAELLAHPAEVASGDFAIAAPDPDVTPYLVQTLHELGCPAYDPSGIPHRAHPVMQVVKRWRDLVESRSYQALRDFVRQSDLLDYLQRAVGVDGPALIAELDEAQADRLPQSLDDLTGWVAERVTDYPQLARALPHLDAMAGQGLADGPWSICDRLAEVYGEAMLTPGRPADDAFMEVARLLVDSLDEHRDFMQRMKGFRAAEWLDLLLDASERECYYLDARKDSVELEGWLELPWNPARLLLVTGMNDSIVPGGSVEDLFLPDTMRERLGLTCNAGRSARDAYLLTVLAEVRRGDGQLALVAGRRTVRGDVLHPSRLFWRCPDEELIRRAGWFFEDMKSPAFVPERAFAVTLDTRPPDEAAKSAVLRRRWNVTDFSAFLACPFRFYLTRILGMASVRDDAEELDALGFGHLVHSALEVFGRYKEVWSDRDPDRITAALEREVRSLVRHRFGRNPPMMVAIQAEAAVQRLRAFAHLHVADFRAGWQIIDVERRIKLDLGDAEIVGKIDRVDQHPDGRIRVIDYKTYDKPKEPNKTHLRSPREEDVRPYVGIEVDGEGKRKGGLRHWSDLQLPLYLQDMYRAYGDDVKVQAGYILLTKAATDVSIAVWDGLDARLSDAALGCARAIIADVRQMKVWPPLAAYVDDDLDAGLWPYFTEDVRPPVIGEGRV